MGLDIYKVSYSDSWRPSWEFIEWLWSRLPTYEFDERYIVPSDEESLDELKRVLPDSLKNEFDELIRRYKGKDILIA